MNLRLRVAFYILLFVVIFPIVGKAQHQISWGGGISAHIPTNGFKSDEFGFKDVAKTGAGVNIGTLWILNPRLSLGSELAYSYFPKNKNTWNQEQRGDIKVNYQMLNLTAQGNFYLAEEEFRPYLGVAFGLYYLRNQVDFSSNNVGTTNDASVSYVSNTLHAGFGPELGVLFKLQKSQYATISVRYTVIPNIEPQYYDRVTINPHGKQNHWSLMAKMFFGKK